MSVIWLSGGMLLGLLLGVLAVIGLAGSSWLRPTLMKKILKSNKEGWVLTQKGTEYELEPLERDDDSDAFKIKGEDDDEADFAEDNGGLMHNFRGVPFGLRLDTHRPLVDVETARAAHESETRIADGGQLEPDVADALSKVQNRIVVGRNEERVGDNLIKEYVYTNPFYLDSDDRDQIVDLRPITRLMEGQAEADTPRKSAKNAVEAERSLETDGFSELARYGVILAAFLLGAISSTYIGGGGGGGGGVDVPIMIDMVTTLL
jgi:hypothetical protein